MSFWSEFIETIGGENHSQEEVSNDASRYAFVDVEVGLKDKRIHDIGILRWDGAKYHSADKRAAISFLEDVDFVCGHNVIHHDMKYLLWLLLFLPTCLMAQNKEEKMPGHITKIQKLEDVNVTGNRPHFIRLKGYYRSYQTNDSVMKYFNDGIVEYYINLKNGKTDLNAYSKRNLHNSRLVSEDKKRAFMVSDKGTFRPWPEEKTLIEQYRKKYQLKDSLGSQLVLLNQQTIGSIQTDSTRNICQIEINQLPTYKNLTHQLFGYTQTDIYDHVVEAYQISPEDYYSFKDLLFQKSDNSYLFSHKKDKQQQLIHVITELYITEKEYVEKKQSIKPDSSTPKESAAAITDFCIRNKIPSLPEATEQEMQQLTPYNPANMKEIKE